MSIIEAEKPKGKSKLEELGVSQKDLEATVIAGEVARESCSPLHPNMYAGYSAYADRIKTLRELLIPKGWHVLTRKGIELVVNPKINIAIGISTGNDSTGDPSKEIESKYSKGLGTNELIKDNQLSLLPAEDAIPTSENLEDQSFQTWYLMVNRVGNKIQYELDLPVCMDEENKIGEVAERIIFEPVDFSIDHIELEDDESSEIDASMDDIVVEVKKKG